MYALQANQVYKTYHSGVKALKGITFNVQDGDFFALLGPNGAGKSTLIGVLTSLVNKTSGQVLIYDNNIDINFARAKAMMGIVPQEFNFSVFETVHNILEHQAGYYGISPRKAKKHIEHYLRKLNLWDKRQTQARYLSGGMKRRLMIVRSLIHQPKMLILDEPTAGIDIELRRFLWDFLKELNESGMTIILTTHYLEEAEKLCRNIAIIDEGKIITNTSMAKLLTQLECERFIFYLDKPLKNPPEIAGYDFWQIDPLTLEVEVLSHQGLNQLFEKFKQNNIRITSMRNKVNRLEELFLKLTKDKKS